MALLLSGNSDAVLLFQPSALERSLLPRERFSPLADPGLLQPSVVPWQSMKRIAGRQPTAPARYNQPLLETGICRSLHNEWRAGRSGMLKTIRL
jgi:hypothetical protein